MISMQAHAKAYAELYAQQKREAKAHEDKVKNSESKDGALDKERYTFSSGSNNNSSNDTNNINNILVAMQENGASDTNAPARVAGYRNTGIAYFNNKENIDFQDAYFARLLGADIQRVDINANVNANIKRADIGSLRKDIADLNADQLSLFDSVAHYEDTYNKQANSYPGANLAASTGRKIKDSTGGFINPSDHANEKISADNKVDIYRGSALLTGSQARRTNQTTKDAESILQNTWKGRGDYYAGMHGIQNMGLSRLNEKIQTARTIGVPISQSDLLKQQLLKNMNVSLGNAQAGLRLDESFYKNLKAAHILQEKGDAGINEALLLITK